MQRRVRVSHRFTTGSIHKVNAGLYKKNLHSPNSNLSAVSAYCAGLSKNRKNGSCHRSRNLRRIIAHDVRRPFLYVEQNHHESQVGNARFRNVLKSLKPQSYINVSQRDVEKKRGHEVDHIVLFSRPAQRNCRCFQSIPRGRMFRVVLTASRLQSCKPIDYLFTLPIHKGIGPPFG